MSGLSCKDRFFSFVKLSLTQSPLASFFLSFQWHLKDYSVKLPFPMARFLVAFADMTLLQSINQSE